MSNNGEDEPLWVSFLKCGLWVAIIVGWLLYANYASKPR